jgi:chemotaxis protein MotB
MNRGQLTVSLNEKLLFRPGSTSRLLDDGKEALTQIVGVLNRFPEMSIQVIGHTDNQPVNRQSLDNWQYSALRAVSVTEYLTEQANLSPNRILAATKGAFAPRVSNETSEGRADNRRVDIRIFPTDGDLERELLRVID